MNIAYVCADPGIPVFGRKGASIHVQEVIRAFLRRGAHVTLFANRFDGNPPPGLEDVAVYQLTPIEKGMTKAERERAAFAANHELLSALEQNGPFDLVYERYSLWSYGGMEYAQISGLPGLLEVNSPLIEEQAQHRGLVNRFAAEHVARHAFGASSTLIAVSDQVASYLENFPEAKGRIQVIPNGVDVNRFHSQVKPILPHEEGIFTIGFVGTLKAWHGLEILVEMFDLVHDLGNGICLLIVGDGPGRKMLEQELSARGLREVTHFTGAVDHDEVPSWLASMDVAVAPYPDLPDFYFSPLKIYEYMAAGLPVVVSDIGQIADVVKTNVNGIRCPAGDAKALASAILRIRNDPGFARKFGKAARATVEKSHTWDAVAGRIFKIAGLPPQAKAIAETRTKGRGKPQNLQTALPSLWRIIRRFRPQVASQWRLIGTAALALFGGVLFQILEPWPLKFVIDYLSGVPIAQMPVAHLFQTLDGTTLITLSSLLMVVSVAARALMSYLSTVAMALAGNRVLTQVRSELYRHLLRLSLSYHDRAKGGDLLTRLVGDIGRLQEVAVTAILPLLFNTLTLVGMVSMMLWLNWQLALLSLCAFPLALLTLTRYSGRIRQAARKQRKRESAMANTASEALGAMRVVKAFTLEEMLGGVFKSANQKSLKEGVQAKRLSAQLERTVDVFIAMGTALVIWYGAQLVLRSALTLGDLIVFLAYLKSAFRPMRDVAKYTGRIAKAAASGERIVELLDIQPDIQNAPHALTAPTFTGAICFENVTFGYATGQPILRGLDCAIEAGQRVALVGSSGAGKSTLTSLLLRLYDPTEGRILVDGCDMRDFTLDSLRSQISIVLQESLLFGATIRENIRYGAPEATDEEIEAAARLANAHEFILELADGYETVVGERGSTLSGGQRQRIAIARACCTSSPHCDSGRTDC